MPMMYAILDTHFQLSIGIIPRYYVTMFTDARNELPAGCVSTTFSVEPAHVDDQVPLLWRFLLVPKSRVHFTTSRRLSRSSRTLCVWNLIR